jgi:dTDP-4-amino-4,6-dideoxygalactose transaminase
MTNKYSLDDLAKFGGVPIFSDCLHVNRPLAGDRAKFDGYIDKIWRSRRFSNQGPLEQELEQQLQQRLGVDHCIMMSNGTKAMEVLLSVMGIKGEVILPSFTFISTPHTLFAAGITPVFCDIEPGRWTISPDHCERLITTRTSAIIATHLWGRPCDIDGLTRLADRHGIPLIFDAAHAFGCSYKGHAIGSYGAAEVFSFHATKAFHCAEGGAVTCNDPVLAGKLRRARNFGFAGYDFVENPGTNAKMSELSAAMGLVNLECFEASVALNELVFEAYRDHLSGMEHISLMPFDTNETSNYWYITCEVSPHSPLSRDTILAILQAENILARRYFYPGCHRMNPYAQLNPSAGDFLPNTNDIAARIVVLPGGSGITTDDVEKTCQLLKFVFRNAGEINDTLALAPRAADAN